MKILLVLLCFIKAELSKLPVEAVESFDLVVKNHSKAFWKLWYKDKGLGKITDLHKADVYYYEAEQEFLNLKTILKYFCDENIINDLHNWIVSCIHFKFDKSINHDNLEYHFRYASPGLKEAFGSTPHSLLGLMFKLMAKHWFIEGSQYGDKPRHKHVENAKLPDLREAFKKKPTLINTVRDDPITIPTNTVPLSTVLVVNESDLEHSITITSETTKQAGRSTTSSNEASLAFEVSSHLCAEAIATFELNSSVGTGSSTTNSIFKDTSDESTVSDISEFTIKPRTKAKYVIKKDKTVTKIRVTSTFDLDGTKFEIEETLSTEDVAIVSEIGPSSDLTCHFPNIQA